MSLKHLVGAEVGGALFSVTATPSGSSGVLSLANLVLRLVRVRRAFACKGPLAILSKTPALGHPAPSCWNALNRLISRPRYIQGGVRQVAAK